MGLFTRNTPIPSVSPLDVAFESPPRGTSSVFIPQSSGFSGFHGSVISLGATRLVLVV